MQPTAHGVFWFMAAFIGLWALSLILRGVRHRSRTGTPRCPGCAHEIPPAPQGRPPTLRCEACRYEARTRREFWPLTPHRPAIIAGSVLLLASGGLFYAGWVWAAMVHANDLPLVADAVSYGLSAGILSLMAWALWGKASGGRRRCPRCWYEMDALASKDVLTCPECGHTADGHRDLHRRQRRTHTFLALIPVLAASLLVPTALRMADSGPVGAIPTFALISGVWSFPDRLITFGPGSLAQRLDLPRGVTPAQRERLARAVRRKLTEGGSSTELLRAAHFLNYDLDPSRSAIALVQAALATAERSDSDIRTFRALALPTLAYLGGSSPELQDVIAAHSDQLRALAASPDPEANLWVSLAGLLGPRAAPLVPTLEAAFANPPVGLNAQGALPVLWALAPACPEAEAALLRAIDSKDDTLAAQALDMGQWVKPTPAIVASLAALGDDPARPNAARALRNLALNPEWWAAHGERVMTDAGRPGPRRLPALQMLITTAADNPYLDVTIDAPATLASAAKDPDPAVRAFVAQAAFDRAVRSPSPALADLLRSMVDDPDPGVARAAKAAADALR